MTSILRRFRVCVSVRLKATVRLSGCEWLRVLGLYFITYLCSWIKNCILFTSNQFRKHKHWGKFYRVSYNTPHTHTHMYVYSLCMNASCHLTFSLVFLCFALERDTFVDVLSIYYASIHLEPLNVDDVISIHSYYDASKLLLKLKYMYILVCLRTRASHR